MFSWFPNPKFWACVTLVTTLSFFHVGPRNDTYANELIQISGIYPHLTMWNDEQECGTGAVVPWQGSLWAITYAPHKPSGSSDKLYIISKDLGVNVFSGSVGGTPANRMIHKESKQLFIGPYVIDENTHVRVIPPLSMYGRLTANARHLDDPKNFIYYATMEEGLYQVNVHTLRVKCLIRDGNPGAPKVGVKSRLPGYHGKGMYSGQGQVIYANNGERHPDVSTDPGLSSGALAKWAGAGDWQLIKRNQFTEVTGPGGIYGNDSSGQPIWSMGWDKKSVILALLDDGEWMYYRLPKGSHSYDGSHGWNTEWPRIRDIGEKDFLATMHGTFWRFPKSFSKSNSAGIGPRSNYLKVIGDFCEWNGRIVFGCDDSARAEFLNTRPFKAKQGAPKQSNSNLWFVEKDRLDDLGPAIGRGSLWLKQDVVKNQTSDPFLFSGYTHKQISIHHQSKGDLPLLIEVDKKGNNQWEVMEKVLVPPHLGFFKIYDSNTSGSWLRISTLSDAKNLTVHFHYRNKDERTENNALIFDGISHIEDQVLPRKIGLMRSLSHGLLGLVTMEGIEDNPNPRLYHLDQKLSWSSTDNSVAAKQLINDVAQPLNTFKTDSASIILEEDGKRYRFPKNDWYMFIDNPEGISSNSVVRTIPYYVSKNLAMGSDVKASTVFNGLGPEKAVDGKLSDNSRWLTVSSDRNKFIEIDLKQSKEFQHIWIFSGWQNGSSSWGNHFAVEAKINGKWKALSEVEGNKSFLSKITLPEPVQSQFIRVTSKDEGHLRVYEVALFRDKPEIQEKPKFKFETARVCREVATERDLLNVHGTFYELPARNAQGLAKIRPIATHNLDIHDFCSHNGLIFFSGIKPDAQSKRIFRSPDGEALVWAGVVDDLWKLGKPRGKGGPWNDTSVSSNALSDPYLMTGYDNKEVNISANSQTLITLQVDLDGTGVWVDYKSFPVEPGQLIHHKFERGFSAYWVRAKSSNPSRVTLDFTYF